WAHEIDLIGEPPRIRLRQKLQKSASMRGRPVNREEFERILMAIPKVRPHALLVLPFAPLPALLLALFGTRGETTIAFDLLLEVRIGLDDVSALFVGTAAFLWTLAGIYATAYLRGTRKPATFAGFWCLTLAGNLGVFLAQDAVTFYASFTVVSLPAYILIVHEATSKALRAGRIYIILAIVGETALLSGLLIAASEASTLMIGDVRSAIASSAERDLVLALMLMGFGIKAGLVPLHMWLPLAHPEAPTPASAVLSGAIVKAGIFGLVQFFAAGAGMGGWSVGLMIAGLFGAYYGVFVGLTQSNPKVILAYSTVSQMGLIIAALGAGLVSEEPAIVVALIALYAAHHGLAKGALFLSVGVVGHTARARSGLILAAVALVALSVAGLPFTGGAAAKAALKSAFYGPASLAVTASAAGTALLLLRFWLALRAQAVGVSDARPESRLTVPAFGCGAAALLLPWALLPLTGLEPSYVNSPANLWSTSWPVLAAVGVGLAAYFLRPTPPSIPPGDLIAVLERLQRLPPPRLPAFSVALPNRSAVLHNVLAQTERVLVEWSVAGLLLLGLVIGFTLLLS
ncbi:MAG: complex I subunit 5 family protein, partial [Pseudomonadota bacterium]